MGNRRMEAGGSIRALAEGGTPVHQARQRAGASVYGARLRRIGGGRTLARERGVLSPSFTHLRQRRTACDPAMRTDQRIVQQTHRRLAQAARRERCHHATDIGGRPARQQLYQALAKAIERRVGEGERSQFVLDFVEELWMIDNDGKECLLGQRIRLLLGRKGSILSLRVPERYSSFFF